MCYEVAGEDVIESEACDLVEHDAIKLLWHLMDFSHLMKFNKNKYTFVYRKMNPKVFSKLMKKFSPIKENLDELLEEIDALEDATLIRIERLVESRTKDIMNMHDLDPSYYPPKIVTFNTKLVQKIANLSTKPLLIDNLPKFIDLDGSTNLFDDGDKSRPADDKKWYRGSRPNPQPWDQDAFKQSNLHADHSKLTKDSIMGYGQYENKNESTDNALDEALGGDGPVNGMKHEIAEFNHDMNGPEHYAVDIPNHYYDGFNPADDPLGRKLRSTLRKRKHLM